MTPNSSLFFLLGPQIKPQILFGSTWNPDLRKQRNFLDSKVSLSLCMHVDRLKTQYTVFPFHWNQRITGNYNLTTDISSASFKRTNLEWVLVAIYRTRPTTFDQLSAPVLSEYGIHYMANYDYNGIQWKHLQTNFATAILLILIFCYGSRYDIINNVQTKIV